MRCIQATKAIEFGATPDKNGCNFSILNTTDAQMELVIFDEFNNQHIHALECTGFQRQGVYIQGVSTGDRYSYRCQKDSVIQWILDHYAKKLTRHPQTNDIPAAVVTGADFRWGNSQRPYIPTTKTILYELHVKGFTQLNLLIPQALRGKFLGLCHPNCIRHFKSMGITSLQLMPIMASINEAHLIQKQLTNYWGYNPISWFAPDPKFAVADVVFELKTMIKTLHQHGIEVILDVVFNHTSESGDDGFSHHFKYLCPDIYLKQQAQGKIQYLNYTGCGNTVDLTQNSALQIVMDSLRYWAQEYQIDGFRFDLAATLGRNGKKFNHHSAFFRIIRQDPILNKVKLIAEPWDIGPDGYQLGHFPIHWHECNDKYRDICRSFWNHQAPIGQLSSQVMGYRDKFTAKLWPYKFCVNYISYHDGFTLDDLVSYNQKHNLDNGENNRDGSNHNSSCNHGVEGPTDIRAINKLRNKQKRNLMATLLFSFGIPHILAADSFSHSQKGNNNAYCQDNNISWINWSKHNESFKHWLRKMIHLRQEYMVPVIEAFTGERRYQHLIQWLEANAKPVAIENWHKQIPLQLYIALDKKTPALLYLFNRNDQSTEFTLPSNSPWQRICDTSCNGFSQVYVERSYQAKPRSIVILRQ